MKQSRGRHGPKEGPTNHHATDGSLNDGYTISGTCFTRIYSYSPCSACKLMPSKNGSYRRSILVDEACASTVYFMSRHLLHACPCVNTRSLPSSNSAPLVPSNSYKMPRNTCDISRHMEKRPISRQVQPITSTAQPHSPPHPISPVPPNHIPLPSSSLQAVRSCTPSPPVSQVAV